MIPAKSAGWLRCKAVASGRSLLVVLTAVYRRSRQANPGVMKRKVRHVSAFVLCAVLLLCGGINGSAFVLIGPNNPAAGMGNYYSFAVPAGANLVTPAPGGADAQRQGYVNHVDPMGWPVPIKEFYRWNWPELTYAFDSTFVRYFGHNGMQAIHNAFEVLNDYFEPQDGSYSGVSSLNLVKEYDQHFASWKYNPSANVGNVYDIETMVLGLLVNHLGLGNPHRHCYTIRDIVNLQAVVPPAGQVAAGNFHVVIRNYDPFTYHPTSIINGVNYSYHIYSFPWYDPIGPPTQVPSVFDAVEYAISDDNEYTAVAGIRDAINFSGLPWPSVAPTVYRTPGVFFAPDDPSDRPAPSNVTRQVRTQPRHTLTFDDAGGLRYLYRTNNIVYETYDGTVTLVEAANMNPQPPSTAPPVPPNSPFTSPAVRTIVGQVASGFNPVQPPGTFRPQPNTIVQGALRGGIDKIKFKYLPYDSLIGIAYHTNTSIWTDVFIQNALPTDDIPANPPYFSQILARTISTPDFVFIADDLLMGAVLPVIQVPVPGNDWDGTMIGNNSQQGVVGTSLGPGVIETPAGASIQYRFTTRAPLETVIWSGQPGIEGNFVTQFQWGWITNTGPNDFIGFPKTDITQAEAITGPSGSVAKITRLTVYDGLNEVYRSPVWDIDRSRDILTIYGVRLDTVTSINVLDHNNTDSITGDYETLQVIDARQYIMSDQQIVLPPGTLDDSTVSASPDVVYRRISLVNSKGESESENIYAISDGRPTVLSTQYDGLPLNTSKSLIIRGDGFKSKAGDINQIWFFRNNNATVYNLEYTKEADSGTGVFPDPIAILDINASSGYIGNNPNVDYSEIVVNDSLIYIPPNVLSDGNYTYTTLGFGAMGQGADMARSEGNSSDFATDVFTRHIRLAYNPDPSGLPNANVNLTPPRAWAQAYTHIGVGGDRNNTVSGYPQTTPTITDVFTDATIPGVPLTADDANRTWRRGINDLDVLTIRGIGLDLALTVEFVDEEGNPIMATDALGLPPIPMSLRDAFQPGVTAPGVTIVNYPPLGRDGYEIRIAPASFGMNANPLFDSQGGTNLSVWRRAVIRTPFGTAMASKFKGIMIEAGPPPP